MRRNDTLPGCNSAAAIGGFLTAITLVLSATSPAFPQTPPRLQPGTYDAWHRGYDGTRLEQNGRVIELKDQGLSSG